MAIGRAPKGWPSNEDFIRAVLASSTLQDAAKTLGLTALQVRHKLNHMRQKGVRVPLLRSAKRESGMDVAKLNRMIDEAETKVIKSKKRPKVD